MKQKLALIGVLIGIASYAYMIVTTLKGSGEGLSFTTFALWSALGWISSISMMKQHARAGVPMIYATGATLTTLILLAKGRCVVSGLDIAVAILTVICIFLWKTKGPRPALILAITASMIAAIPFAVITWKDPLASPIVANIGFFFANLFSCCAAKAWTYEDRLYSVSNMIMCSFFLVPCVLV